MSLIYLRAKDETGEHVPFARAGFCLRSALRDGVADELDNIYNKYPVEVLDILYSSAILLA